MTEEEQVGEAAPVASGKFFFPNDAVYEGEYKELAADEDEAAEAEGEEEPADERGDAIRRTGKQSHSAGQCKRRVISREAS